MHAAWKSGGYGGCCPRFPSLDRRRLMLFRLVSVIVVRQARLALAVFLKWEFYRLLGSLLPDCSNENGGPSRLCTVLSRLRGG